MRILLPSILIVVLALTAACVPIQPEAPGSAPDSQVVTLYVGPELVDCVGVGPMKCMQVKSDPNAEYEFFYSQIEGFEFEEGFEYELEVQVDPVANPPADASSLEYTLLRILNKQPVAREPEVVTMYVGPELVDCVGAGPMKCMQVKTDPDAEYLDFYDQIEGFDYEEGYEYELIVQVDPRENPPADASSLQYTLIEQVDKQPVE
jgi:hypothetical protein